VPTVEQDFLPPGVYRVGKDLREFTAKDLGEYKAGTLAALDAGITIPVLDGHAPNGADDELTGTFAASAGKGWLIDLKQKPDGGLTQIIEVTDPKTAEGIKNGSIKFSSPELRENYIDGKGRKFGRVIRHVALVSKPHNPDQGKFVGVQFAEDSIQFGEEDRVADDMASLKKPVVLRAVLQKLGVYCPEDMDLEGIGEDEMDSLIKTLELIESTNAKIREKQKAEAVPTQMSEDEEDGDKKKPPFEKKEGEGDSPPEDKAGEPNPDLPSDGKGEQKAAAIVALLSELGIELPADFDLKSDVAIDLLLTGLKTAVAAVKKVEAEKEVETDPTDDTREEDMGMPPNETPAARPASSPRWSACRRSSCAA
jgi:hypothetical protein